MTKVHIWLRSETKPGEARRALAPGDAAALLAAGFTVTVEDAHGAAFPIEEYRRLGCAIAAPGAWRNAPPEAYILGLKELPEDEPTLRHHHIYFAHAYKGQQGWRTLLQRFARGQGTLLDLEYLVDEDGRRLAAFGYWAGYIGAALGVMAWCGQRLGLSPALGALSPWRDREALLGNARALHERTEASLAGQPLLIIIGAAGRVGSGARELARNLGLHASCWDIEETARGGPFPEILEHDVLVNCVLADRPMPPFLTPVLLSDGERRLSVIADVSCDPYGEHNPLPLYDRCTTLVKPLLRLHGKPCELDVIAIDHLPSLLPRESSEDFSAQLLPVLLQLGDSEALVWQGAAQLFQRKLKEAGAVTTDAQ
jgi:alanine dehydrogenase